MPRAGRQAAGRIFGRTTNRDEPTTWQTRQAQYDAVCAWGIPNHSLLQRVSAIELPVFVANGDSDRNVCLIPSSAHGTNAASAVMAGMKVVVVRASDDGSVDLDDLIANLTGNRSGGLLGALLGQAAKAQNPGAGPQALAPLPPVRLDNGRVALGPFTVPNARLPALY